MSQGLLAGKKGIITGIANERSIAWACAQACEAQGAELIFSYLGEAQEKRMNKLLEQMPNAKAFPCDASDDAQIAEFMNNVKSEWGNVDFLIHSIAFADKNDLAGRYVDTSRKNFAMALDISAYTLVALTQAVEPLMENGGSIVAMTYLGAERVMPRYNVMGVAKAALEASAKYLASDLGQKNIRVNCVSAGPVRTLSSAAISGFKKMLNTTAEVAPMRRNITPQEVANATVYLLSDLSTGTTGEVHHVDAGYNILGMFDPTD
jgi:enoyl-[acyl-carrier protein] reductase I